MENNSFSEEQKRAIERMREMNKRSSFAREDVHKMPPAPAFVQIKKEIKNEEKPPFEPFFESKGNTSKSNGFLPFGIPPVTALLNDSDTCLILGLLLILMQEKSNKLLLFALIYILL